MTGWWRFVYRRFGWNYPEDVSDMQKRSREDCLKQIRAKDFVLNKPKRNDNDGFTTVVRKKRKRKVKKKKSVWKLDEN